MQVDPIEVWDLLALLGLPPEWTADAFLPAPGNPSREAMERARLFRSAEARYGEVSPEEAQRLSGLVSARSLRGS